MRRFLLLCVPFVLLSVPTMADEVVLPELFSVIGNSDQAPIYIRSEPNEAATIVETLTPKANSFEVVAFDPSDQWAQVNIGESSGWIERRSLVMEASSWANGQLPDNLSCYGTEPFWSLRQQEGKLVLSTPDTEERSLNTVAVMDRGFEQDRLRSLVAKDNSGQLTAVVQPNMCSDGMSDRSFALGATLIVDDNEQTPRLLTGCCSIAPR